MARLQKTTKTPPGLLVLYSLIKLLVQNKPPPNRFHPHSVEIFCFNQEQAFVDSKPRDTLPEKLVSVMILLLTVNMSHPNTPRESESPYR